MEISQKDVIVGEQWLVLSKIGEGSFGEVFKAQDINFGRFYAVKRESLDLEHPQLRHESKIYDILAGGPCIPKRHWYGQHDGFDCIVIDLLGSNLKQFQQTTPNIPLDLIIDFGCQLISCLEHIHDKGIVYRDVKPENFLFSASFVLPQHNNNSPPPSPPMKNNDTSLFAVDFGLATWWRNPKTMKAYTECKKPIKYKTGTARYASLNIHRGRTHARRDDMESLGYLLLDLLLNGDLPWSGITARSTKAGWDRLKSIKEEILLQDMCLGLPYGIMNFIDYTRRLRFTDRPDYDYLRRLLIGCNQSGPFSKLVTSHPNNTRLIPSPSKYYHNNNYNKNQQIKRKSSYNNYHNDQEEDVFVMDDIAKELPSFSKKSTNYRHNKSSNSSNRYYHYNHKKHYGNKVGWNTHKNYTSAIETKSLQTP